MTHKGKRFTGNEILRSPAEEYLIDPRLKGMLPLMLKLPTVKKAGVIFVPFEEGGSVNVDASIQKLKIDLFNWMIQANKGITPRIEEIKASGSFQGGAIDLDSERAHTDRKSIKSWRTGRPKQKNVLLITGYDFNTSTAWGAGTPEIREPIEKVVAPDSRHQAQSTLLVLGKGRARDMVCHREADDFVSQLGQVWAYTRDGQLQEDPPYSNSELVQRLMARRDTDVYSGSEFKPLPDDPDWFKMGRVRGQQ